MAGILTKASHRNDLETPQVPEMFERMRFVLPPEIIWSQDFNENFDFLKKELC